MYFLCECVHTCVDMHTPQHICGDYSQPSPSTMQISEIKIRSSAQGRGEGKGRERRGETNVAQGISPESKSILRQGPGHSLPCLLSPSLLLFLSISASSH